MREKEQSILYVFFSDISNDIITSTFASTLASVAFFEVFGIVELLVTIDARTGR